MPENYIAILGDSYAEGGGDWLYEIQHSWAVPDYASHQLIHRRLGRDVVSFGESGAGSLSALMLLPENLSDRISRALPGDLENPSIMLVYFYEGNDLNDNILQIEAASSGDTALGDLYEPTTFDAVADRVLTSNFMHDIRWYHSFWFSRFIYTVAKVMFGDKKVRPVPQYEANVNRIVLNGETVVLPDRIQSPALELEPEQIAVSAHIFEQALQYVHSRYRQSQIFVVYIPSPLACYELATEQVSVYTYHEPAREFHDAAAVRRNSDLISLAVNCLE